MSTIALVATASEKHDAAALVVRKLETLHRERARAYAGKISGDPFAAREVNRLDRAIELLTTGE